MSIKLRDDRGGSLGFISMGLGWDPVPYRRFGERRRPIDLDASALLYAGDRLVDAVYYGHLASVDGSVRHHGDNMTGEGRGDDEVITVDLTRLPPEITCVLFLVTCLSGQLLAQVKNVYFRLVDATSGIEIARYEVRGVNSLGLIMGVVYEAGGGWCFQEVVEGIDVGHPSEAVPMLGRYLP
ncbi:TerD family protein [Nocardia sp. NPDC088792]|uniref:TerD family protein n=1 Tax=Nocardia sp. NPDC088792 TaxID=3364332 RepID=UPI0038292F7B